jgi:hypothetical protein
MAFEPTKEVLGQSSIGAGVVLPPAASDVKLDGEGAFAQRAGPRWPFPNHVAIENRFAGGFG